MADVIIKLDSIDKVKGFVDIANRYKKEIRVLSGRSVSNGKSILGILSLDLKNELTLEIEPDEGLPAVLRELEPYIIS